MKAGANRVKVLNRTASRGEELAAQLGATAVPWDEKIEHLKKADIVVSSTSCPQAIISHSEAEEIMRSRGGKPIVMIDIAVPRDIEASVREIEGIHLFDMDDLESVVKRNAIGRRAAAEDADKIVHAEVQGFRRKLMAERVVPTIVALRRRLDDLCRQELDVLRKELGPFTEDQDQTLSTLTSHITQRIAGSLARELKELPEAAEQDVLTSAVDKLFHLELVGAGKN
jgi:glutamyl-tRNA reductase